MDLLIKSVSDAGLGLGSLVLITYLFVNQTIRQDKKDQAYIETLAIIQNSVVKTQTEVDQNRRVIMDIATVVKDSATALKNIKCLQK